MVSVNLARKFPEKIRICSYYTDNSIAKLDMSAEEYAEKCNAETHSFLDAACKKISDFGERFVIHEENGVVDLIFLQDIEKRLENLKKILAILNEFPARWTCAEVCWDSEEIPENAEKMARKIVETFHDQYVHIGDRVGKLECNDQGEIIFKKRYSKHYGFRIDPFALCKEYVINHSHFKRGGNNGSAFTDLSEVSYWR